MYLFIFSKMDFYHMHGNMTEENYGSVWTFDHCYPSSKTNLSDKNEMIKST